jgi:hypothetical protein
MYGPTFEQQGEHLRRWIEEDEASGPRPTKLDFIVSVMFWSIEADCPQASTCRKAQNMH